MSMLMTPLGPPRVTCASTSSASARKKCHGGVLARPYEHWRNVTREHLIHRFSNPRWQILNDWSGSNFHTAAAQQTSAFRRRNGPSLLVRGGRVEDGRGSLSHAAT